MQAVAVFDQIKDTDPEQLRMRLLGRFTLTAYAVSFRSTGKRPNQPNFGITYSGTRATVKRTVAVDPRVIPIGSLLYIEGLGWRLAEDVGGLVKGRHIDVLLESDQAAIQFGVRRNVPVYVFASGDDRLDISGKRGTLPGWPSVTAFPGTPAAPPRTGQMHPNTV